MRNIAFVLAAVAVLGACKASPSMPSFERTKKDDDVVRPGPNPIPSPPEPIGIDTPEGLLILLGDPKEVALPRLTHTQWGFTVRDLLSLQSVPDNVKNFPVDPATKFGNDGTNYFISGDLWAAYRAAAEDLATKVGSNVNDYKKLLPSDAADGKAIVSSFLKRAYRRPVTDKEVSDMLAIYNKGSSFFPSIKDQKGANIAALIGTVLQSPLFLYRSELGKAGENATAILSEYEVASRLSYTIWNSMPDAALFQVAEDKSILKSAARKTQVERMLNDPKGKNLLKDLHYRAYGLGELTFAKQDTKKYPELAQITGDVLKDEAALFSEEVFVKQQKGVEEFLSAPYAFVSSKSADIYGLKVSNPSPQKTDLDPTRYAGIATQAAFLNHYSRENDASTSIIKRGAFVAQEILCRDFTGAPPPPALGKITGFKTNREYIHNLTKNCGGCHTQVINPLGNSLESFSPSGKFRTTEDSDSTAKIDPTGQFFFADKSKFNFKSAAELMKEVAKKDETHQCYAKKIIEGLYAKPTSKDDGDLLLVLAEESLGGTSGHDLIIKALTSDRMLVRYGK
jgi:hypothetical protein